MACNFFCLYLMVSQIIFLNNYREKIDDLSVKSFAGRYSGLISYLKTVLESWIPGFISYFKTVLESWIPGQKSLCCKLPCKLLCSTAIVSQLLINNSWKHGGLYDNSIYSHLSLLLCSLIHLLLRIKQAFNCNKTDLYIS